MTLRLTRVYYNCQFMHGYRASICIERGSHFNADKVSVLDPFPPCGNETLSNNRLLIGEEGRAILLLTVEPHAVSQVCECLTAGNLSWCILPLSSSPLKHERRLLLQASSAACSRLTSVRAWISSSGSVPLSQAQLVIREGRWHLFLIQPHDLIIIKARGCFI